MFVGQRRRKKTKRSGGGTRTLEDGLGLGGQSLLTFRRKAPRLDGWLDRSLGKKECATIDLTWRCSLVGTTMTCRVLKRLGRREQQHDDQCAKL